MKTQTRKLTLITLALLALGLVGYLVYNRLAPASGLTAPPGYNGQPTLGRADAPVKVILFENFLCDHCKAFETEVFPQLKRDYIDTGKVEAYYVNLAWGNESATTAGLAGECAYHQDAAAFWDYKRAVFEAQGPSGTTWATLDTLVRIAREHVPALEPDSLRVCIAEGRYRNEVERDLELGDLVGVQGTPSIVVGNEGFEAPSYRVLKDAIERQLAAGGRT